MANPKRTIESYHTESFKKKQSEKIDRMFGVIESHQKVCKKCGKIYRIIGRINTKKIQNSNFCSRSCANHRGTGKEWEATHKTRSLVHYRTICFTEWEKKCVICDYDRIVDVHHLDENHKNNDVKNLIPLCPNHHMELHHKDFGSEIKKEIDTIILKKWGIGIVG